MRYLKNKYAIFFLIIILTLIVLMLYLSSNRIAVYFFSKIYNIDIAYKNLKGSYFKDFMFENLSVIDRKNGLGFFSKSASIRPGAEIVFYLRDVHFIKKGDEPATAYDNLSGLVSIPFSSRWTYKDISGKVRPSRIGIDVNGLIATSDDVKLSLTGSIYSDNTIKSDIVIYFSDKLIKKMPEELSKVIMRDENDGWRSLSVKLEGNYNMPSIQVSGKLFRLNIGVASES